LYFCLFAVSSRAANLEVLLNHVSAGESLQMGSLRYVNASGEEFSITRVSYLLSGFGLQRIDGTWVGLTNRYAWIDAGQGRTTFSLGAAPDEKFRSIRFQVGVGPTENHADIAKLPANHPLNPNVNGLHWNWQGGYIFMALEGMWRHAGALEGWSYHLARDPNYTTIQLDAALDLTQAIRLVVNFDLADLFRGSVPLSFVRDGSSTHSRDGDPIAAALTSNLSKAFRVMEASAVRVSSLGVTEAKPLYLPAKFTPYPFRMSSTFPMPELARDNPLMVERVELGKKLFNETLLSRDRTLSCASCHKANAAFSDSKAFSLGVEGKQGKRNAMPLFNLAWKNSFFWDGRAPSLRAQALMPMQDHLEMDQSVSNAVALLCAKPEYAKLFQSAFGSSQITGEKIGLAIEQFLLTQVSFDSRFDRALEGKATLTEEEQRGFELFSTEYDPRRRQFGADCFHCHGGPLFQSQTFANNGLDSTFPDKGRAAISGKDSDLGKFAVPSLRNVTVTGPYMHDGRFRTLEEVVEHYSTGVKISPTLDPNIAKHPAGGVPLSQADKKALVAFLKTLTDEQFAPKTVPALAVKSQ
jgi:cytochrome c peroxidase